MLLETFFFLSTFSVPEQIGLNPQSMLLLLPLVASIAIVYKALKIPKFQFGIFLKEVATLFLSIVAFITVTALVLFILVWLVIE
ncbi:MAG: hypothetical protein ACYSUK_02435 [Planctomycetota bacterium]|jgi:hypothetical protein